MENNKYHILIVEDDKEIRDGVEIYLKNQGYQVWKAANGKEGLEIVAQEEIHLAILDIMMPVMDGYQVLRSIRDLERDHGISEDDQIKVIMTTALNDEENVNMAFDLGCSVYSGKPINKEKFDQALKKLGLI